MTPNYENVELSPADEEAMTIYLAHEWDFELERCKKCGVVLTDGNETEICTNPS